MISLLVLPSLWLDCFIFMAKRLASEALSTRCDDWPMFELQQYVKKSFPIKRYFLTATTHAVTGKTPVYCSNPSGSSVLFCFCEASRSRKEGVENNEGPMTETRAKRYVLCVYVNRLAVWISWVKNRLYGGEEVAGYRESVACLYDPIGLLPSPYHILVSPLVSGQALGNSFIFVASWYGVHTQRPN